MKLCARPVWLESADLEHEVAQDFGALRGVVYFGMELHGVILLRGILDGRHRIRCLANQLEAGRKLHRLVAVRHPNRQWTMQALEQWRIAAQQLDLGMTVLALVGSAHFAAQLVHHELQSVADSQHRQTKTQHALVRRRRIGIIYRRRSTRQHNARGVVALDFFQGSRARQDDGEDVQFADAARDELRILRTEVEDYDRLCFHHLLCQRTRAV